jgi:serine/threonine-protein kinase
MTDRILQRALSPSSPSTRATRAALPPDLLEKSRDRVKLIALVFLVAESFLMASDLPAEGLGVLVGGADAVARWAVVLMSAVLFGFARNPRVRPQLVLQLGLSYEIALCLLLSILMPHDAYVLALKLDALGQLTDLLQHVTWTTPIIIMFPLIIPSPPRTTLWIALAAAATAPLGLALLEMTVEANLEPRAYPHSLVSPAIAVAVAYFGSRIVYSLGIDVSRAREMGSYRLTELIGRGGMGEVWKAKHRMLARPAAVKLVRPDVFGASSSEQSRLMLARFEREAQATASLRSPHTIELYDFGATADGTFYYVAELLDGFDCNALVRQFGPVPAERVIHLLHQVCDSLGEAHEHELIHRDIKPGNVLVCRYGRKVDFVKVLDFGLVKARGQPGDDEIALTADGVVSGTPAFMSPEQVLGNRSIDARSDIYAVGCLAYWLLTGELVFQGTTAMEVMIHHAHTQPHPPSGRTELGIPASLDEVILSCLAKDPDQRPQSADELSQRLDTCAQDVIAWTTARAAGWWDVNAPATGPLRQRP